MHGTGVLRAAFAPRKHAAGALECKLPRIQVIDLQKESAASRDSGTTDALFKVQRETESPDHKEIIMRALHTALVLETGPAWTPVVYVNAGRSAKERADAAAATRATFRNMTLFLSAPFIGLLYALLLPFVGLGMLAWFGGKAIVAAPAK